MNVLSLFDGMSCGFQALKNLGIKVDTYFASEIDPFAIKVAKHNHPEIIHLGSVVGVKTKNGKLLVNGKLYKIDLILAGSPCQGFSFAGKQLNFEDPRSKLFFEFLRLKNALNPEFFLLENVKMKGAYVDIITNHVGVNPVLINSALVSAQNRERYYWSNCKINQPEDKKIFLKDILTDCNEPLLYLKPRGRNPGGVRGDNGKSPCLTSSFFEQNVFVVDCEKKKRSIKKTDGRNAIIQINPAIEVNGRQPHIQNRVYLAQGKSPCLTAEFARRMNVSEDRVFYRRLLPVECERLQTLPDSYTASASNTQRYKMLGNGWTLKVVEHILSILLDEKLPSKRQEIAA